MNKNISLFIQYMLHYLIRLMATIQQKYAFTADFVRKCGIINVITVHSFYVIRSNYSGYIYIILGFSMEGLYEGGQDIK